MMADARIMEKISTASHGSWSSPLQLLLSSGHHGEILGLRQQFQMPSIW